MSGRHQWRALLLVVASACALTAACGSDTPTSPSGAPGQPDPFFSGRLGMSFHALDDACTARTPAWGFFGPSVLTRISVSANAQDFIGRSDLPLGEGEVRFRVTPLTAAESTVSGTARGVLYDMLAVLQFPSPAHVTLGGAHGAVEAELTGVYHPQLRGAMGDIAGTITFTDNQGGVMTCTRAQWLLVGARQ